MTRKEALIIDITLVRTAQTAVIMARDLIMRVQGEDAGAARRDLLAPTVGVAEQLEETVRRLRLALDQLEDAERGQQG